MVGLECSTELSLELDKVLTGDGVELGELNITGPGLDKGVEASDVVLLLNVLNTGVKLGLEVTNSSCSRLQLGVVKVVAKNIPLHGVKSVHNLLQSLPPGFNLDFIAS